MKIVYLAAGAGGMYCGSCLHDNTLAAALSSIGQDVLLVPAYTPIRTDEPNVSQHRVMFGGVNVYLQQKLALFRHTPWFLDRLLDWPPLLRLLSKMQFSVDASKLGSLTVSVVEGESGKLRKEVAKLVHWLASQIRPNVVLLSNAMLVGMARQIKRQLHVPVLCALSGEDIFLEKLKPPYYERVRKLLRQRANDIDAFIALNHYYADYMADYLAVERARIEVIPPGLKLEGHGTRHRRPGAYAFSDGAGQSGPDAAEFTIGYLARIHPDKGLHHLADAFKLLAHDPGLPSLKLRAAGYLAPADRRYLAGIQARLADWGLQDRFDYAGELDRDGKIAFLQSLDVMSVPTVYRESKGLSIYEALANAVPVVVPAHGCFPELIEDTGGGLLCEPEDPASLAQVLRRFIEEPQLTDHYGQRGQQAVHTRYTAELMARRTKQLFQQVCARYAAAAATMARRTAPEPASKP